MTMLKTFDLKGNKQSFANWISNLSPCETPFISMVGKEKVDQVQYSWQTDALTSAKVDSGSKEGDAPVIGACAVTTEHHNFTQIYRKAVRVSDTTKKIALYGRASELALQMEKAGMEIKRDLEHAIMNSQESGRLGTAAQHGISAGVQRLVAAKDTADTDTGAVVHKVVTYADGAGTKKFTQLQVFDMTYQLYLAGARANKIMVHPVNMHIFSDWIMDNTVTPHVHRMFDGMDTKFNAHVSSFRDPLGQVFDIIPNRYMPTNQLFFFNPSDWSQMVLREPTRTELAKNGSSEKFMIEMEVGLRHRNPFASAILEFNKANSVVVKGIKSTPANVETGTDSTVTVVVTKANGDVGTATEVVTLTAAAVNDDGTTGSATTISAVTTAVDNVDGSPTKDLAVATATVKHAKASRVKVRAHTTDGNEITTVVDSFDSRD